MGIRLFRRLAEESDRIFSGTAVISKAMVMGVQDSTSCESTGPERTGQRRLDSTEQAMSLITKVLNLEQKYLHTFANTLFSAQRQLKQRNPLFSPKLM
jgi:hypothetical protein